MKQKGLILFIIMVCICTFATPEEIFPQDQTEIAHRGESREQALSPRLQESIRETEPIPPEEPTNPDVSALSDESEEDDLFDNPPDPIHRADPDERDLTYNHVERVHEVEPVYEIFETKSNYNFIQLDTMTGQMYIIHLIELGMKKDDSREEHLLNGKNLAAGKKPIPGRFTLYPTFNMWTFILLDQIDGGTWQVQWSERGRDRFIEPIFFLASPESDF